MNTETFINETEHMDNIYERAIKIKEELSKIQDEIDSCDSDKLEEELHKNHIGWESNTKDFWIKRIEGAIHALSFAQPY